jgi:hypothetical protein
VTKQVTPPAWRRHYLGNERYLGGRTDVRSWVWLSVSLLLNTLSFQSIAERHAPTGSSLTILVQTYQRVFGTLAKGGTLLPQWMTEAVVIMGGIFAAANYFALKADGTNITNRLLFLNRKKPFILKWWTVASRVFLLYIIGPLGFIFLSIRSLQQGRRFARILDIAVEPRTVIRYYCFLLIANVALIIFFRCTGV